MVVTPLLEIVREVMKVVEPGLLSENVKLAVALLDEVDKFPE